VGGCLLDYVAATGRKARFWLDCEEPRRQSARAPPPLYFRLQSFQTEDRGVQVRQLPTQLF
jgi:hypothetical protein